MRPTGVYLLDFFCSGIQFYLLLSPYLCFISFSRRWLFNKYIFNCILLSIYIHNAYICIQNSIGMFQVGVERWFVLSIEAI